MSNEVRITVTSRDQSQAGFRSARQSAQGLGDETKKIGQIAAGILASQVFARIARAAKDAFVSTISAASDLNESMNAVDVMFGRSADGIHALGETSAQSMGLSQRAFNEAAVQYAAFAEQIAGASGRSVVSVIEETTQRAADFASVFNIDVDQAMSLFQSGLAGQSRPLRQYGIDLSEAAVQAFAVENGISAAGGAMTEQEKVLARYGLIMEQTAATSGDFANTSGDLANSQRILGAEVENMQASMGQNMLPVLASVTGFMTDLVVGFGQLPGPVQTATGLLLGAAAAAGALSVALRILGVSLSAFKAALGPIGIALAVGGAIVAGLAAMGSNARASKDELQGLTDAVRDNNRELAANELEQLGVLEAAEQLGIGVNEVTDAYLEGGPALESYRAKLEAIIAEEDELRSQLDRSRNKMSERHEAAQEQIDILADFEAGLIDAEEAERRLTDATGEATGALYDHEEAVLAAQEAYDAATSSLSEYTSELAGTTDPLAKVQNAQERVAAAQEAVNELVEDGKQGTPEYTAAVTALWGEQNKLDAATLDAAASLETMRADLKRAFEQGKISEAQYRNQTAALNELERQANDTAGDYKVDVLLDGVAAAERQLAHLTRLRNANIRVNYTVGTVQQPGGFGRFAHGGIVGSAQGGGPRSNRVLVGEAGPEVVDLPFGSRVIPSVDQATDRGQGGNGNGPDELVVTLLVDGLEDKLVEALRQSLRVRGERLGG